MKDPIIPLMLGLGVGAIVGAILTDPTTKTETHYLYRYRPNISAPDIRVRTGTEAAQIDVWFAGWTFSTNVALPKATSIVERLVLVREASQAEHAPAPAPTVGGASIKAYVGYGDGTFGFIDIPGGGKTNYLKTGPAPAGWTWTKDIHGSDVLIRVEALR